MDGVESHEQLVLWDAMAEAARRQFLASGELVLIASPEHWIDVANRHLSFLGMGRVSNASVVDDNGGVELTLPSTVHPAIVTGRLLGCWERAEGRGAKGKMDLYPRRSHDCSSRAVEKSHKPLNWPIYSHTFALKH